MSLYAIMKDNKIRLKDADSISSADDILIYRDGNPELCTIRQVRGTGWAFYYDSQYTELSPLNIDNGTAQVTIDSAGAFTDTRFLPDGVTSLWSSNRITPENVGDTYSIRLDFFAVSSGNADKFTITLDIGDGGSIVILTQTFEINKSVGSPEAFSFDSEIFALETFVANGGRIMIQTDNNIDFYNFGILIKRDHKEA